MGRVDDREAFRVFAEVASPGLLRLAYLLLNDRAMAEDVLQTTLLRTYQHWRRAKSRPSAYGRAVLVNLCRDYWRSGRRLHERPVEPVSLDRVVNPDATDAVLGRAAMDKAMTVLSRQQRDVLVLRYYADLSVADTAKLLHLAEGTVKSATSRGLSRLRGELLVHERPEEARFVE